MALSATSYPEKGLTFAILYGCTSPIEEQVLESLDSVRDEASHPCLLPGIFVELELLRHARQVDIHVLEVETTILNLDAYSIQSRGTKGVGKDEAESRYEAKRSAWLDLTYLRNSLITTNLQIQKLSKHTVDFGRDLYNPTIITNALQSGQPRPVYEMPQTDHTALGKQDHPLEARDSRTFVHTPKHLNDARVSLLQRMDLIGEKIVSRLNTIQEEYEEKIRECTMRVEGMVMTAQWASFPSASKLYPLIIRSHIVRQR
jgi:hypothetical protein